MKNQLPLSELEKKPLYLPMQKVWFDEIESGRKTEEYRDGTDHYKSRFFKFDKKTSKPIAMRNYSTALLQEGYNSGARRLLVEVNKVEFDGDFTVFLGSILERLNFDRTNAPKRKASTEPRKPRQAKKKAICTIDKMIIRRGKISKRS